MKLAKDVIKPRESDIKKEIRAYLKLRGIWHYNQWQGQFSHPGVSDICGIYKGKPLYIEVKIPNFRTNTKTFQNEMMFQRQAREEGAMAFFATSVNDVIEKLP